MPRATPKFEDESKYIGVSGFGRWVRPVEKGYRLSCCDCGLVHEIEFMVGRGSRREPRAMMRFRRDSTTTRAHRLARLASPKDGFGWSDHMAKVAQAVLTDLFGQRDVPQKHVDRLLRVLAKDIKHARRSKR